MNSIDLNHPPAGVSPLVWLLIFLAIGPPMLMSKAGARLPGFLGAVGRWWQAREPAARSYRVSQEEIKRLDEMYTSLREDFDELQREVHRLSGELTDEKREKWAAISYGRTLIDSHRKHAPDVAVPSAPDALTPYFG